MPVSATLSGVSCRQQNQLLQSLALSVFAVSRFPNITASNIATGYSLLQIYASLYVRSLPLLFRYGETRLLWAQLAKNHRVRPKVPIPGPSPLQLAVHFDRLGALLMLLRLVRRRSRQVLVLVRLGRRDFLTCLVVDAVFRNLLCGWVVRDSDVVSWEFTDGM